MTCRNLMFAAVAAFTSVSLCSAHFSMTGDFIIDPSGEKSPLDASGSNFPCHGADLKKVSNRAKITAGQDKTLDFDLANGANTAVHGGGSCQISLTYETDPEKVKDPNNWKVIHSFIGGCPSSHPSNLDFAKMCTEPNKTDCVNNISFKIPDQVRNGDATLAWTWFNTIGNREMYMNCGAVTVEGGQDKLDELPAIFVANLDSVSGGCKTVENTSLEFPDPGPEVTRIEAPSEGAKNFPLQGPVGCAGDPKTSVKVLAQSNTEDGVIVSASSVRGNVKKAGIFTSVITAPVLATAATKAKIAAIKTEVISVPSVESRIVGRLNVQANQNPENENQAIKNGENQNQANQNPENQNQATQNPENQNQANQNQGKAKIAAIKTEVISVPSVESRIVGRLNVQANQNPENENQANQNPENQNQANQNQGNQNQANPNQDNQNQDVSNLENTCTEDQIACTNEGFTCFNKLNSLTCVNGCGEVQATPPGTNCINDEIVAGFDADVDRDLQDKKKAKPNDQNQQNQNQQNQNQQNQNQQNQNQQNQNPNQNDQNQQNQNQQNPNQNQNDQIQQNQNQKNQNQQNPNQNQNDQIQQNQNQQNPNQNQNDQNSNRNQKDQNNNLNSNQKNLNQGNNRNKRLNNVLRQEKNGEQVNQRVNQEKNLTQGRNRKKNLKSTSPQQNQKFNLGRNQRSSKVQQIVKPKSQKTKNQKVRNIPKPKRRTTRTRVRKVRKNSVNSQSVEQPQESQINDPNAQSQKEMGVQGKTDQNPKLVTHSPDENIAVIPESLSSFPKTLADVQNLSIEQRPAKRALFARFFSRWSQ